MKRHLHLFLFIIILGACAQIEAREPTVTTNSSPTAFPTTFDIEGHRGARGLKPENILPAFETALDLGVTTLELDMHFTSDGVVVIWHDPKIEASKCRRDPETTVEAPDPDSLIYQGDNLAISNLTFSQVQTYLCDRNPDRRRFSEQDNGPTLLAGEDYRIISLEELFDFVEAYSQDERKTEAQRKNASLVQFNIETKRDPNDPESIGDGFDGINAGPFEQAVLKVVMTKNLVDRVILQSFDHRSLWAVRDLNNQIRLAALTSGGRPSPAEYAKKGASIWSPNQRDLTQALIEEAHDAGLLVIPWTVNELDDMQTLIILGVDGLITDRPDILVGLIRGKTDNDD